MKAKYQGEISLNRVKFYAYHGVYEHERINGGEFWVDISVKKMFQPEHFTGLENTINYEKLYAIAESAMGEPEKLLETVAKKMADEIEWQFQALTQIRIRIEKLNPPIGGDLQSSAFTLTVDF